MCATALRSYMKKFVVISHTHWDREWYLPFSLFRMKLVDLIDRLLPVIEKDKDYIFHLDAQTVVLEDYLEIRPENEAILKKYIESGNIRVGPWYLQNDFYLTDGEATIRNLQLGRKIAESFGRCGKAGYAPDQFGNVSQLPQILKEFGIDNFVFGRGFHVWKNVGGEMKDEAPAEFEWTGADGTRCLAVHMKFWYNNAQRIPEEKELAKLLFDINEKNFAGLNVSPYILLMNGVDHLEPQDDVRAICEGLRKDGVDIKQYGLDEYIEELKESVKGKELYSYKGALNRGADYELLRGCWSSRIYLKEANVYSQDLLENKIEALYSYMLAAGFEGYPQGELDYLWKNLLRTHPHDSICGCSVDPVHAHMEDTYAKIAEMGEYLVERGMKIVAAHGYNPYRKDENYSVTVFNPTERTLEKVAEAELKFMRNENITDFALKDDNGEAVQYEIVSRTPEAIDVFSPLNLPGVLEAELVKIRFIARVPAVSARVYAVIPREKGRLSEKSAALENEFYSVYSQGGKLYIKDKTNGKVIEDPIRIEDSADKGDAYVYRLSPAAPIIVSPAEIRPAELGALKGSITAEFRYSCPARYDFAKDERSAEAVENKLTVTLSLEKGSDVIAVDYSIDNKAEDHRVRLLIKGGLTGGRLFTDSPFDYAEREDMEHCYVTDSDTHHNSTFTQLMCDKGAFTVYTSGQHEVEKTADGIALTILRCTAVITRDGGNFMIGVGKTWLTPGGQCKRTVSGRIGLDYGKQKTGADCFIKGKAFRNGFTVWADSFDAKKYSGGRFAVQAAALEKLYYVKDRYEGKVLPNTALFGITGDKIAVTCVKRGKNGGIVVRMVNLSDEDVSEKFTFRGKAYSVGMAEDKADYLGENSVSLAFTPKRVLTVLIK